MKFQFLTRNLKNPLCINFFVYPYYLYHTNPSAPPPEPLVLHGGPVEAIAGWFLSEEQLLAGSSLRALQDGLYPGCFLHATRDSLFLSPHRAACAGQAPPLSLS